MYLPAKNKLLFLVANRFTVHTAVASVVAIAAIMNIQTNEVRAESFGENSILYNIMNPNSASGIEEVMAQSETKEIIPSTYLGAAVISEEPHIDFDYIDEEHVTTRVGGSALSVPTIQEGTERTRTETETYIVQEGDTSGIIAEKFGISLTTLLWANDLSTRSTIRPGDTLKILPTSGLSHTIKRGDTVAKIAKIYNVTPEEIIEFNRLASADDIAVGESIIVPNGKKPAPAYVAPRQVPSYTNDNAPVQKRGASTGSGTWVWPTDWRVITQYYGWRHTGLDIDGDYNTSNYAAAGGTVSFVGWRNGYGLTVEVDHGGGITTRYAHASKNLVSVGDQVSAGQALQKTGTTGRSTGTHLHFEVIVNGKFQNPLNYIR
ncbi:MAG: peptidase M23 [uncultured bacterium]|nr:MAG: peptidase M23 [uncultured bacterium]HBD05756.1 hypothetical protein [Candidatus Uhrbacteria bacterium]